jgi:AcrR family transcriptional regulator
MARPRKEEARDTRQDILSRALDLFAEKGFYGTSMREIARAVGIRESATYHHFPSKASILEELLRTLGPGRANQLLSMDFAGLVEALGPEGMLRRFAEMATTIWATPEERKIFRVMLSEGPRLRAEGLADPLSFIAKGREGMARVYAELVRRGMVRPLDPVGVAQGFMGPMILIRLNHLALPEKEPDFVALKADVERHVAFFWQAVKAESKPASKAPGRNRTNVRSVKGGR